MIADWPGLNAKVWLRLPCCGAEHPTRVDDYVGNDCAVGAPITPHTEFVKPPHSKDGFFLGWVADGRGALEAPVELVRAIDEPIPTWVVRSIGDAVQTQRRNYIRMEYNTEALLHLIDRGAPSKTNTLDVSEGGLRCVVDEWAPDPGARTFKIELPFNGKTYLIMGQIAWWGNLNNDDTRIVGVRFVDIERGAADAIRAYIFATQLEERRRNRS